MGVLTNSPVFNKDSSKPNMDQEFGVRAIKFHNEEESCKTSIPEEEQDQEKKPRSLMKSYNNIIVSVVPEKLEIPSYDLSGSNDRDDDGYKTPTSSEHKIPPMLKCPGAPRKKITKTNPKRKAAVACCRRLVFDLSKEVESMFATSFVEDLPGTSDSKKLKNCVLGD